MFIGGDSVGKKRPSAPVAKDSKVSKAPFFSFRSPAALSFKGSDVGFATAGISSCASRLLLASGRQPWPFKCEGFATSVLWLSSSWPTPWLEALLRSPTATDEANTEPAMLCCGAALSQERRPLAVDDAFRTESSCSRQDGDIDGVPFEQDVSGV